MRPCVVLPCFFKNTDFCHAVKKVAAIGYDAVELWGWGGIDPVCAKATLDETGVELISLCTTEFRLNNPEYREAFLDGLKKAKKDGAVRFYIPIELAENICIALEHLGMLKNDSNEGMLWRGK